MPELIKGEVAATPRFFYARSGTPVLKFLVHRNGDPLKRVAVIVFGDLAEKHQKLAMTQKVLVSGTYEENTYNGETEMQLKISARKGNIKLVGDTIVGEAEESDTPYWEQEAPEFVFPDPTDVDYELDTAHWNVSFPRTGELND